MLQRRRMGGGETSVQIILELVEIYLKEKGKRLKYEFDYLRTSSSIASKERCFFNH